MRIWYHLPVRERNMANETTYSHARANFAAICDEAVSSTEPVIIHRRGAQDVALISAAELRSLQETAHLLRSPENAQRLLSALRRARARTGTAETPEAIRVEFGLVQEASRRRRSK
ncbi:MAG: type II toxin-antitoxin system prevent-host-death family antitoxin [Thermoanaerobaculia bacterium]